MYVVRSRRGCVGRGGLGPGGLFCEKRRTDPGSGGSDPSPGSAGLTSPEPGGQGGRPSPSGGKNPTQTGAPPRGTLQVLCCGAPAGPGPGGTLESQGESSIPAHPPRRSSGVRA